MVILLKRFVTTLIGGGLAYFVWMALLLLMVGLRGKGLDLVLWFLAPSILAAGFTVGLLLFNQLNKTSNQKVWRIYLWPLAG
jgi:hypothetical protein